jgi:hypothetical protein
MTRDLSAPYPCARIDREGLADLLHAGITMRLPQGRVFYFENTSGKVLKEIGRIRYWDDTGHVDIYPYRGIDEEDQETLAGQAWETLNDPPTAANCQHWERLVIGGRKCWQTALIARAHSADPVVQVIRAAQGLREHNDLLFGSDPSSFGSAA